MQVKVNVDAIGPSLDTIVEELLKEQGLPECLGNMIPPLLDRVSEFDSTKILTHKSSVPPREILDIDLKKAIFSDLDSFKGFIFTNSSREILDNYKNIRASSYVNHIARCVLCKHQTICFKLTTNYLRMIQLDNLSSQR